MKLLNLGDGNFFCDLPDFQYVKSFGQGEGIFIGTCFHPATEYFYAHDIVNLQYIIFGKILNDESVLRQLYLYLLRCFHRTLFGIHLRQERKSHSTQKDGYQKNGIETFHKIWITSQRYYFSLNGKFGIGKNGYRLFQECADLAVAR